MYKAVLIILHLLTLFSASYNHKINYYVLTFSILSTLYLIETLYVFYIVSFIRQAKDYKFIFKRTNLITAQLISYTVNILRSIS